MDRRHERLWQRRPRIADDRQWDRGRVAVVLVTHRTTLVRPAAEAIRNGVSPRPQRSSCQREDQRFLRPRGGVRARTPARGREPTTEYAPRHVDRVRAEY